MIKSMTGFAKSEATENGITAIIELKSLNGRYLEMNCRMPRSISYREREIRDIIKEVLDRGTVTININLDFNETAKASNFNKSAAIRCFNSLEELRKELKMKEAVKMEHILTFSDQFLEEEDKVDEEAQFKVVLKAMQNAIKSLDTMRIKEGSQIAKDIKMRVGIIEGIMEKIEELSIKRVPEEKEKMRERIAVLFESDEIDEQRLQTEMVILADKLDVTEECTRMSAHIEYFNDLLKEPISAGRKMNFLLQEMHREVNTIGSKISDSDAARLVVEAKEELEKIREQVQNVE